MSDKRKPFHVGSTEGKRMLKEIERLTLKLKQCGIQCEKYDDIIAELEAYIVSRNARVAKLEAGRENWYCELCGCESCIKAEALANSEANDERL